MAWGMGLLGAAWTPPPAFELIESYILTGNSLEVQFSVIPQDFKHLQLRCLIKGDSTRDDVFIRLNTAANHSSHALFGIGSGTPSSQYSGVSTSGYRFNDGGGQVTPAGSYGAIIADILDYTNPNINKTIRGFSGRVDATNRVSLTSGATSFTTAITSIAVNIGGSFNMVAGSRFSLYGIKG